MINLINKTKKQEDPKKELEIWEERIEACNEKLKEPLSDYARKAVKEDLKYAQEQRKDYYWKVYGVLDEEDEEKGTIISGV